MGPVATRITLQVSPRAARPELVGRHGDGWKVRVAAAPADGRANEEALGLLASAVDVPRTRLTLVGGASARTKTVEIAGLGATEVERRLTASATRKRRRT